MTIIWIIIVRHAGQQAHVRHCFDDEPAWRAAWEHFTKLETIYEARAYRAMATPIAVSYTTKSTDKLPPTFEERVPQDPAGPYR